MPFIAAKSSDINEPFLANPPAGANLDGAMRLKYSSS
jgi:hypothetical protein